MGQHEEQVADAKAEAELQKVAERIVGGFKFTPPPEKWPHLAQYKKIDTRPCPNCPYGGPKVGGRGIIDAPCVIIGESPGFEETKTGVPFVGPSGEVLNSCVPTDADVLLLNALQCRPIGKQGKADKRVIRAIQCCAPQLFERLLEFPRKSILALGNVAMWSLTGDYNSKITLIRGKVFQSKMASRGIVASVHPAYLLRGSGSYVKFKDDVKRALDLSKDVGFANYIVPYHCVHWNAAAVQELVREMLLLPPWQRLLGVDIETSGFDRKNDYILSFALCWDARRVHVIPGDLVEWLKPIFEKRHNFTFIWHNGKFDCGFLRRPEYIGRDARVDEDTMLLSYALNEARGFHDLETVANDTIGAPDYKYIVHDMLKKLPKDERSYANVPRDILYKYQALDVSNTFQCFADLRQRVAADAHLEKLYTKTLIPASELLLRVEYKGIAIDPQRISENQERLSEIVEKKRESVQQISGIQNLNPQSPKQLVPYLFDKLRLRTPDRNTDKSTLAKIKGQHPIIEEIMAFRVAAKANNTYAKGFWKYVKPLGNAFYIFSTFLIHGTRTGRFSSKDPNIMNIPRDDKLRGMFTASSPRPLKHAVREYVATRTLMEIDLNQAELRVLAQLSGDPVLVSTYCDPQSMSIHDRTATRMFGLAYSGCNDKFVKNEMKMKAKNVNFGVVYGITAPGLAEQVKGSTTEAQEWLDGWAQEYKVAWDFLEYCGHAPMRGESIITCFGRKKRFGVVTTESFKSLSNEAKNMPEQSIATDINTHGAMELEFSGFLEENDAWIVNLIHDATLFDLPDDPDTIQRVAIKACQTMESIPPKWGLTRVPFKADASIGYRWGKGNMTELHLGKW